MPAVEPPQAGVLQGGWFVRQLDSLFVLRPTLIFPLWTMILAGCNLAKGRQPLGWQPWTLFAIGLTGMFGLVYLLNQMRDQKTDAINQKLFLVSEGAINRRHQHIETAVLVLLAVVSFTFSGKGLLALWVVGLFLLIGVLYNFTPLTLKQRPWGGLITYAVSGWMFVRLGEMIYHASVPFVKELPYVVAFVASCLLTNLPDIEGDRAAGKRTFTVAYGIRASLVCGAVGFGLALIGGLVNGDLLILIPSLLTFPFMVAAAARSSIELSVAANKWAIFLLSIAVGVAFPAYIIAIAVYYPVARWYYKQRMGLAYPTFKGK